ncbi:MAG: phosphoglycerol geranylgeranyltransferase [Candidatus Poseidoniales archaeon]|nr:MAG: phosphoglycerol geranylgeranyltransferase [Candidatus Poseidoniales archaeon]
MLPDEGLLNYILDRSFGCRHITLIDPGKQSSEIATRRAIACVNAGSRMIFIGGSTDTPDEVVHETCKSIQEALELQIFAASQDPTSNEETWRVPVVLFPGGAHALSPAADGITFMMLMNSESRKFLVGEQLRGAPHLDKFGVEALPTGYLVFSPGGKVGEVGEAQLIESNQTDLVKSYSLTAKMFGFKILYLEAGSGASTQVDESCISAAREVDELCLIVGGGIRTSEQAAKAARAGANWIVTGTLTEDASNMDELSQKISDVVSGAQSSS